MIDPRVTVEQEKQIRILMECYGIPTELVHKSQLYTFTPREINLTT